MNYLKLFCVIGCSIASVIAIKAADRWNINGVDFTVDTLYTATVGPGTVETELCVVGPINGETKTHKLFYTTVDLTNPNVEMRAVKAGNSTRALETVPQIASRYSSEDEVYFAGVNADFFSLEFPYHSLGANIMSGSLARRTLTGPSADIDDYFLSFDCKGVPTFARHVNLASNGKVQFVDGSTNSIVFNDERRTDYMVLYTKQWQRYSDGRLYDTGYTGTNEWGTEVALVPVDKKSTMWGGEMELEVVSNPAELVGNMLIPAGGYVLSGHGASRVPLSNLRIGDKVRISADAKLDNGSMIETKELIGGFPFILVGGTIQATLNYPGHLSGPEPRTAVGYNADKSKLIMLVVDGRNAGGSAGVSQNMLAQFCKKLGCSDAMNFDGGGSSTMYINKLGVRNIPSGSSLDSRPEGTPRAVVNALCAVATAPADYEVASIEIREKRIDLNAGEVYVPTVYAYNKYGVLVDADLKGYKIDVAPELGSVTDSKFTAGTGNYKGDFTVSYNGLTCSIPLFINGSNGEYVASGICESFIDMPSVATEYYTIMGQRISNPVSGTIVIEKKGDVVVKRVVN